MAQEYNGVLEVVLTVEFVDKILWCTPFKWNLFRKISISLAAASSCHIFDSTIMKDSRLLVENYRSGKSSAWCDEMCQNVIISTFLDDLVIKNSRFWCSIKYYCLFSQIFAYYRNVLKWTSFLTFFPHFFTLFQHDLIDCLLLSYSTV